jgi:uncharacterized protein YndB with AHSA1/START domain
MTGTEIDSETETRAIVVEREMPHPPEKVWRALTQGPLIAEWLMDNDFQPVVGHRFAFRGKPNPNWNGVADCEVLTVEPPRMLAYSWRSSGAEAANGLRTVVTWTLTPTAKGTLLRLEHSGFRHADTNFYKGASGGWPRILERLDGVAAGLT